MADRRLIGASVLLTVLATSGAASAQQSNPPPPKAAVSVVTNPDWIRRPSAADLERYYPAEAKRQGLSGTVRISCRVDAAGLLVNCRVLTEQPPGAGFGEAALQMASLFQMKPTTRDGEPVGGAAVTVPIRFGITADAPAREPITSPPPLPVPPVKRPG